MELLFAGAVYFTTAKGGDHGSWNSSVANRRSDSSDYYLGAALSSLSTLRIISETKASHSGHLFSLGASS